VTAGAVRKEDIMRRLTLLALIGGLMTAGCNTDVVSSSDLMAGTWRLQSFQEGNAGPQTVGNPSLFTLRFDSNGRVAVVSDCNTCDGTYSLSGNSLSIGSLSCSKTVCVGPSLDAAFQTALGRIRSVEIDDALLVISGDNVTLRFAR
jgi:heat shock protein HslJ